MRLFHGTDNAKISRPAVLTLGVFDGLHLGHQLIMRTVVRRARAIGAVPTVITFEPHPRALLHPESAPVGPDTARDLVDSLCLRLMRNRFDVQRKSRFNIGPEF